MRTWQSLSWIGLLAAAVSCRSAKQAPEPGAVLLQVTVTLGAPSPDQLRVSVYDVTGTLWSDVRVPDQGALVPQSATRMGTILIQPGASTDALRLHVRGLAAGARVVEGVLTIAPQARAPGTFDMPLDPEVLADGDADGVPDLIDDCVAVANPAQGGCPDGGMPEAGTLEAGTPEAGTPEATTTPEAGTPEAGTPEAGTPEAGTPEAGTPEAGMPEAGVDASPEAGSGCDAGGACNRPMGAACTGSGDCAAGFCADGVCCADACVGRCRSCSQMGTKGICVGYAAMSDPALECAATATTCNGTGACGPASTPGMRVAGEICTAATECGSGFCKDGVCCNTACDAPCETCETGTCQPVKRLQDIPECSRPMGCNTQGRCVYMGL